MQTHEETAISKTLHPVRVCEQLDNDIYSIFRQRKLKFFIVQALATLFLDKLKQSRFNIYFSLIRSFSFRFHYNR